MERRVTPGRMSPLQRGAVMSSFSPGGREGGRERGRVTIVPGRSEAGISPCLQQDEGRNQEGEGGREGRREGGKEGRREGGREGRKEGG